MIDILQGDCRDVLATLPAACVQTCVTSPPYYGLRDYNVAGQIGLEKSPDEYVAEMVDVFRAVKRVLRDDGTCWLNLGDSYNGGGIGGGSGPNRSRQGQERKTLNAAGYKPKDLLGIPWRVAFALQADGWYLRSAIVWHKPNPMPESVRDRPTGAHEMVFLLAKSATYFYDADAVAEPARYEVISPGKLGKAGGGGRHDATAAGQAVSHARRAADGHTRNLRNVWTITPKPFRGAHFATMPPDLVERCLKAGSRPGDTVLDPFFGAGTTGLVASRLGRHCIGTELNPDYCALARARIDADGGLLAAG